MADEKKLPPPEVNVGGPTAPYPTTDQPGGMYPQVPQPQPGPGGYPPNAAGYPPPQQGGYPPQTQQPGAYPPPQPGYPAQTGPGGEAIGMQPMPGGAPGVPGVPGAAGWAPSPQTPLVNCPPGLEYLGQIDQLLVKQKMEALEAFTGFETNNKYEIRNSVGQRVYMAVEDTCCCTRNCCGASRPFDMKIMDNQKKEIMHLERPLRCSSCLCPCCLQKLMVEAPKGSLVGIVRQAWSCCYPSYKINNAEDETMLRIKGPCCRCNICGDIEFEVTSPDGSAHVGQITKQWSGLAKEIFTDADNFGVTFPLDLDVKTKATMLGAVFLIDFMYFEHDSKDVKDEAKRLK